MKIKDLQREEKPREKLIDKGAENLTDVELLAIILRSGGSNNSATSLSRALLNRFQSFKELFNADMKELENFKYIGHAKATSIKALGEISKRYVSKGLNTLDGKNIRTPQDVYSIIHKDTLDKDQEYLFLLTLDSRSNLISKDLISKGLLNETLIHPREIFKKALAKSACSIILVHNHPSNKSDPSDEDIKVTKRIVRVGIEMGIPLIDHLIVTNDGFSSMKSLNLLSV